MTSPPYTAFCAFYSDGGHLFENSVATPPAYAPNVSVQYLVIDTTCLAQTTGGIGSVVTVNLSAGDDVEVIRERAEIYINSVFSPTPVRFVWLS
jgi:hypothetical protein